MTRRALVALSALGCMLLMPPGAFAQGLDLKAPASQRLREREPHGWSRRSESDLYPSRPPVPYAPGFLAPLSKDTESGRAGVAGWTAPNTAGGSRGAADPDNAGWLGFGFALEWGGSPKSRGRN